MKHHLDLLCLCELGEHEIGLEGAKNLQCRSQEALLGHITDVVNSELRQLVEAARQERNLQGEQVEVGLVEVELVSGQHATYAAIRRCDSRLAVEDVIFHERLDPRSMI